MKASALFLLLCGCASTQKPVSPDPCTPAPVQGAACGAPAHCAISCNDATVRCAFLACEGGVWTYGEEMPER